ERAPHAELVGADQVRHRVDELIRALVPRAQDRARRRASLRARVPAGTRADEEAELDLSVAADLGHRADVLLQGEGDAGPRGDPMDGYLEPVRLGEHRLQAPGPFHAGDLDPVVAAVGERLARL